MTAGWLIDWLWFPADWRDRKTAGCLIDWLWLPADWWDRKTAGCLIDWSIVTSSWLMILKDGWLIDWSFFPTDDKPYRVLAPLIPVVLRSSPPPSPEGGKIRAFILTALSDFSSYYLKKKIWVWFNPGSGGKNFPRPLARKWQSLPPARPLIISHLADSWRSLWGCRVRYGFLSIWHVIVIEMQLADKNGPGE